MNLIYEKSYYYEFLSPVYNNVLEVWSDFF